MIKVENAMEDDSQEVLLTFRLRGKKSLESFACFFYKGKTNSSKKDRTWEKTRKEVYITSTLLFQGFLFISRQKVFTCHTDPSKVTTKELFNYAFQSRKTCDNLWQHPN